MPVLVTEPRPEITPRYEEEALFEPTESAIAAGVAFVLLRLSAAPVAVPDRPPRVRVVRDVEPLTVPPLRASVPMPSAPALPSWSVPWVTVVPPMKVSAEARITVPVAPAAALIARAPRPLLTPA